MSKGSISIGLLIIILLGAYLYSGVDYLKQRQERQALTSQVADVTQTLARLPVPPQDLEQRLEAAEASRDAAQRAFPGEVNSTQVINGLLEMAAEYDVKAIPLLTAPWSTEKIGEHNYYVFRLNIAIEGSFSNLLGFLSELEGGELETLVIEDLSVSRVSGQLQGPSPQGTIPVEASLDVAIYAQAAD